MKEHVSLLLVGIGGYGAKYVEHLFSKMEDHAIQIVGAVDPQASRSKFYDVIRDMKIPIYQDMASFYESCTADLAVISSPIHYHCEQTCFALEHGSNVLCEKPAAATVQEVRKMIEHRDRFKKTVAIGFQWVYDPVFLKLKQDILADKLGKPLRLKTVVLWPRDNTYYTRSPWAGRIRMNNRWILDSVANNAAAHFLHNMFFILGDDLLNTAFPEAVQAELYRANRIESFDTCCMRIWIKNIEILFYATHASKDKFGPYFEYEFENGKVIFNDPKIGENKLVVFYKNGEEHTYGTIDHGNMRKLWVTIEKIRGKTEVICPLESALAHTLVINGAHESSRINDFPEKVLRKEQDMIWVENLSTTMADAFENDKLFSEMGVPWAQRGELVDLTNYDGVKGENI